MRYDWPIRNLDRAATAVRCGHDSYWLNGPDFLWSTLFTMPEAAFDVCGKNVAPFLDFFKWLQELDHGINCARLPHDIKVAATANNAYLFGRAYTGWLPAYYKDLNFELLISRDEAEENSYVMIDANAIETIRKYNSLKLLRHNLAAECATRSISFEPTLSQWLLPHLLPAMKNPKLLDRIYSHGTPRHCRAYLKMHGPINATYQLVFCGDHLDFFWARIAHAQGEDSKYNFSPLRYLQGRPDYNKLRLAYLMGNEDVDSFAWSLLVLIDLVEMGLIQIIGEFSPLARFIRMVGALPLELRMLLCNTVYREKTGFMHRFITNAEVSFGWECWRLIGVLFFAPKNE